MVAHSFLVQDTLTRILSSSNIDRIEAHVAPANRQERDGIKALRRMINAKEEEERRRAAEAVTSSPRQEVIPGALVSQLTEKLNTHKLRQEWGALSSQQLCQSCGEPPQEAVVTNCLHVYCEECLSGLSQSQLTRNNDSASCAKCQSKITGTETCAGLQELELPTDAIIDEDLRARAKGRVNLDWVMWENNIISSAKIKAVCDTVGPWLDDEPDKKIIIFSQFHMMWVHLSRDRIGQN